MDKEFVGDIVKFIAAMFLVFVIMAMLGYI